MRALRFHGAGDVRLEDVPEVSPPAGWVKLSVAGCGICGTDIHEYTEGPTIIPAPGRPHPLTREALPLTLGHEFSGTVVELGDGVDRLALGDRVAVEPTIACRTCDACRSGRGNRCPQKGAVGLTGWGGGYADYATVPEHMLHVLPEAVSLEAGALVEPLAVGWHAAALAGVGPEATVLIMGAGPIGLGALVACKALGAPTVAVAGRRAGVRLAMAEQLGADVVALSQDVPGLVDAVSHGRGLDIVIEASGAEAALAGSIRAVRIGGTVATVGLWPQAPTVDLNAVMLRELCLVGARGYAHEFPLVIGAVASGAIPRVERMITKRVSLPDAVTQGFDELAGRHTEQAKILVIP